MADRTIFLLLLGGTPGSIHISTHFGQEDLFDMYIDHLRHCYRQQREQQQPCIKKSVSGYAFHSIYILPRIFDACKFQRITIYPIPDAAPNRNYTPDTANSTRPLFFRKDTAFYLIYKP